MADFAWLDFDDRGALTDALIALGLVGEGRAALLGDLDGRFRLQLRNMPDDLAQLQSDIAEINRVERLIDGQIPMRQILRRAEAEAERDPAALSTIRRLRAVVEQRVDGQPLDPIEAPPPTEIPEAILHRDDMVDFAFLVRGAAAGRSVARLTVDGIQGGAPLKTAAGQPVVHRGTGWLVAPDLLLTCRHVVRARGPDGPEPTPADLAAQVAGMQIHFDLHDATAAGEAISGGALIAAAGAPLDYALIEVAAGARPGLRVEPAPVDPAAYFAVNILQHPEGRPLRVALRNNVVAGADATGVRYYTDTLPGASGAPVCDDQWRVRAIHRATRGTRAVFAGKRVQYENVGTPIGAVLADIARQSPAAAARIDAARGVTDRASPGRADPPA